MPESFVIGVDFDGTLATHEYPGIGDEVPGAMDGCKALAEAGAKLILFTMRSGVELENAVRWCRERGVVFWGLNKNPDQHVWTSSPKVYAHVYIDDAAHGCPLVNDPKYDRPYVNWGRVTEALLWRIKARNAKKGQ